MSTKATILTMWFLVLIAWAHCYNQSTLFAQVNKQEMHSEIFIACDSSGAIEARREALKALASRDDWQALGRVLVWVTKDHNKVLRKRHAENEKDFVQNVDGVQSLPIPEDFVIRELVRINNPGAIPYLRNYYVERFSLPVTSLGGETRAALEASIEKLEATLLDWSPNETDR